MFFPLANFFNQLNVKPSLQNQFPKNPNQSRQFTVPTMPDSALRLCAARLYNFCNVRKPSLQNVHDEIENVYDEIVCMSIICLFQIVMLQKIRKNKDASHK